MDVMKNSVFLGEGTFALRDVPQNTVFVVYSGVLMNREETHYNDLRMDEQKSKHGWSSDQVEYTNLWKYKYALS